MEELTTIIGEGAQATVYQSGEYAIKCFKQGVRKQDIFYEAMINSIIEQTPIQVPKTYEVLKVNHQYAIKSDVILGPSLIDCLMQPEANVSKIIEEMVELHIQVHQQTCKLPRSHKERLTEKIKMANLLSTTQKERLLNQLQQLPDGESLCHGDFHGHNLIVSKADYYVIDWVDASNGCACGDVCRTYLIYLLYAPELANAYLMSYCQKANINKEEIMNWLPVVAAARLSENIESETERLLSWIAN